MMNRRAVVLCCAFVFVAFGAFAQNFTGTWSGSFSGTSICDKSTGNVASPLAGTAKAELLQSGSGVTGALTLTVTQQCSGGPVTVVGPVAGTANGSTVVFSVDVSDNDTPEIAQFSMTVNGASLSISGGGQFFALSGTLAQTSAAPPDGTYSGTYTGTYTFTKQATCGDPNHPGCTNLTGSVTSSGTADVVLLQTGSTATGTAVVHNEKDIVDDGHGNCTIVTGDETTSFAGIFNGNVLTIPEGNDTVTITFSGGSFSGGNSSNGCPAHSLTINGTRTSSGNPPPSITSFVANPPAMSAGSSTTLIWSTVNATSVSIDNGVGTKPANGSASVSPTKTTTYTLTATGIGGTKTASATITVTGSGPHVVAASMPQGMLQASGEAASGDSFALANIGTDPANVAVASTGGFFTVSSASLTLQPLTNQSITIRSSAQPAGTYDGSITITGQGVPSGGIVIPVHLLVAARPAGTVNPEPAVGRVNVSAPAGQNPSGSVTFQNSGKAAMNGIAVSDVAWLVPQSGPITLNPGETKDISFTVDRSKRPDASAPLGGVSGNLSLRFLGSPVAATGTTLDTTPTSTVTVSIVDAVKPTVAAGTAPPLVSGELALFIAGHGSTLAGISSDLLLSNRGGSLLTDVKLYFAPTQQFATLPSLAANLGITLPAVSTSIFNTEGGGNMMLRGSLQDLAAAAIRYVNPIGRNLYATAMPVFRSDRGVGPGGKIALTGVEQSTNVQTLIFIQELSGSATTADLQAYDANGQPIGTKSTVSINGFLVRNDGGTTVSGGARSVVITNTGSGRINAYARIVDQTSGDAWIVTDAAAMSGSAGPFVIPTLALSAPAQTDVYLTNVTNSPVSATLNVATPTPHRRAVRSTSTGTSAQQQVTIQPLQTQKTTITPSNGYVLISGPVGSLAASGRMIISSAGQTFGSSLPVMPVSVALTNGHSTRFIGVGDASHASIANNAPGTSRSTLMLLETSGQSATVRVSIWYTFPAGALVSAQTVSSKNFVVPAGQVLVINDLARSVIGPQREGYGDLRDMQVDVEVVDGAGAVLPFIESVDNHSGDVVVRSE